jgi:His/Glu/Gln/Arg/opine family amino acid ABC transporter permease subunit
MDLSLLAYGPNGWGDEILAGLGLSLSLAVMSYAAGVVYGTLCGLVELRGGALSRLFSLYSMIMRSLPELIVILFVFYGAGFLISSLLGFVGMKASIELAPFPAGVVALTLIIGCYASEVVKGAVSTVPSGMSEAAQALGLARAQTLSMVVLPLALRNAFPGLANLWTVVVKTTPLVSAIQLEEFIRSAGTAGQNTKHYFLFYGVAIAGYLVISGVSLLAQHEAQKRLFRHMPGANRS